MKPLSRLQEQESTERRGGRRLNWLDYWLGGQERGGAPREEVNLEAGRPGRERQNTHETDARLAVWHGQAGAILEGESQMSGWAGRYPSTSR